MTSSINTSSYPYKSPHIDYLQIGAHIGNTPNDPIYNMEIVNKNIILIEPVPFLYDMLKYNYKERIGTNEIEFLNIAVSDYDGMINLVAPSKDNDFNAYPFFLNQMASTTDRYIKQLKFQERFPNFKFETISVPCRTLHTIIQERGITSLDHLFIDTEGHDETILRAYDFHVKPNRITFEKFYMNDINLEQVDPYKHPHLLFSPKYYAFLEFLASHGYQVLSEDIENTTVILRK